MKAIYTFDTSKNMFFPNFITRFVSQRLTVFAKSVASVVIVLASLQTSKVHAQCNPTFSQLCTSNDFINNFFTTGGIKNISKLNSGCNGNTNNYIFYSTDTVSVYQTLDFDFSVQSGPAFTQGFVIFVDWTMKTMVTKESILFLIVLDHKTTSML